MVSPQGESAPTGQKIERTLSFGVKKPRSFAPDVVFIESDGANHLHERRVEMAFVQFVLPALLCVEPRKESLVHSKREGCARNSTEVREPQSPHVNAVVTLAASPKSF